MLRSSRGVALVDLVFTCGLVMVLAAVAIPNVQSLRDRDAARMAARYLAHRLQALRVEAVRQNRMVAMRFDPDDLGRIAAYADGDGDGVSQRDIDDEVDPVLEAAGHAGDLFADVSLRIASTLPSPDGVVVAEGSDPVRIGNTNLVSFSPLGSATSGTIYLAGRGGTQTCIRIFGATGRLRVLWFDASNATWRQD